MTTDHLDNQVAERTSDYPTKCPLDLLALLLEDPIINDHSIAAV